MQRISRFYLFPLVLALSLTACQVRDTETIEPGAFGVDTLGPGMTGDQPADLRQAVARMQPTQGNNVRGEVRFIQEPGGLRIQAQIEGLGAGEHGFHVHEIGDCSHPQAESAGGHFSPHGRRHGAPDAPPDQRHVGDLGNITGVPGGVSTYDRVDPIMTLEGENSVVGRSVIVHAQRDDLQTQPTGDAGARLACGVVEPMNVGGRPGDTDPTARQLNGDRGLPTPGAVPGGEQQRWP
jgi:superoxide dismutase, Cu-Zn family